MFLPSITRKSNNIIKQKSHNDYDTSSIFGLAGEVSRVSRTSCGAKSVIVALTPRGRHSTPEGRVILLH